MFVKVGAMNKSESKYFNTAAKMDVALISLLKKKPLEYITVSEICKTANVNRSTFYLHYENVGDLLEETVRYLLDGFLSYFSDDKKSVAHNISSREEDELIFICDEYIVPYLKYIKDNKEVFGIALINNKTFRFDNVYKRMFENIFNPILDRFNYRDDYKKYVMMYYLNGINALILEWIKDKCKKPIEEISEIIKICIYGLNNCK